MLDLRIIRGHDFLRSNLEGEIDLHKSRRILRRLVVLNADTEYDLLIDMRKSRETLNYKQVIDLVHELCKHAAHFKSKVALLDNWDAGLDMTQFFEAVATHHGFQVHTFVDFEEAMDWLQPAQLI